MAKDRKQIEMTSFQELDADALKDSVLRDADLDGGIGAQTVHKDSGV